jgi:copper resistance protein D
LPLAVMAICANHTHAKSDARAMHVALAQFSTIGIPIVAVLLLSGLINSGFLIGLSRWRALFTTGYGATLLVKLGLFSLMLVLAALNRYRTTPALRAALETQGSAPPTLGALQKTVLSETLLAFLVLLAVSVLGTLTPPVSGE